jgi:hypothetical protein
VSISTKLTMAVAAALALTGAPALAATTIDFTASPVGTIANGDRISNQYASLGVTFSLFENGAPVGVGGLAFGNVPFAAGLGNALFNTVGGIAPISPDNRADILRLSFLSDVSGLSFLTNGFTDITVFNAFDSGGNLLQSLTNTTGGVTTISFSASGIARVDALQGRDDFAFGIDQLSFISAAVPEPATWAMMLVGFGAVGFAMRRRNVRTSFA